MYAPDRSPIITLFAEEGVRSLVSGLPGIVSAATDLTARTTALYGAWLCGACLGATTMSLHHKLCHALGGTLDLPHAETHTVVLPHVARVQPTGGPGRRRAVGVGARSADPAVALWDLAGALDAPRSLAALGMAESDIDRVAEQVAAAPYANPRPASAADVAGLLHDAWSGARPRLW